MAPPAKHHPSHGLLERALHTSVLIGLLFKMLHSLNEVTEEFKRSKLLDLHVTSGWKIFNRKMDKSDDWTLWRDLFLTVLWKWFLVHAAVARLVVLARLGVQTKKCLLTSVTVAFLLHTLGPTVTALHLVQILLPVAVARLTRSRALVWLTTLGGLVLFDLSYPGRLLSQFFALHARDTVLWCCQEYVFLTGTLRSTSSSLFVAESGRRKLSPSAFLSSASSGEGAARSRDELPGAYGNSGGASEPGRPERRQEAEVPWRWVDIVSYNLYFPLTVFGPFMTCREFLIQFNRPERTALTLETGRRIVVGLLRALLWSMVYEAMAHFFYHSCLLKNPYVLGFLTPSQLLGAACVQAQLFMVRHLVVWTVVSPAALLDGLETPKPPACVSRVYLYSSMWQSFDRGFYSFLREHIYLPLGGRRRGRLRYFLAVLFTFGFALVYHGVSKTIFVWVVLNVFSMLAERAVYDLFFFLPVGSPAQRSFLSPEWRRRLHSLVHVPLFLAATFGSFLLLSNWSAVSIISRKVLVDGFPGTAIFLAIGCYSFIQTAKDYENRVSAREETRNGF